MTTADTRRRSWLRIEERRPGPAPDGQWAPITEWLLCESLEAEAKAARDLCDEALRHEAETNTRCRVIVTVDEAVVRGEKPTGL